MTAEELVPQQPAEVQVLDARSKMMYEKIADFRVNDEGSFKLMAEMLRQVKELAARIEERFEPHIKRANDTHKGLCSEKKKALGLLLDAEKLAKDKLGLYYADAEEQGTPPSADGVSVIDDWSGEVSDAAKLPRKYLIPDTKLLLEHTKLYKDATKIPGWKVTKGKRIAQKI